MFYVTTSPRLKPVSMRKKDLNFRSDYALGCPCPSKCERFPELTDAPSFRCDNEFTLH